MPFIPNTPESLIQRSDSKNPSSTCCGVTSNGRPCRRPLSKSPQPSPSSSPPRGTSPNGDAYCWQHKEQGELRSSPSPQRVQPGTIQERTSVDTLYDRLGLLEIEGQKKQKKPRRKPAPELESEKPSRLEHSEPRPERRRPRPQQRSNLGLFCCIGVSDEQKRPPRPVHNSNHGRRPTASIPTSHKPPSTEKLFTRPPISHNPSSQTSELLSLIPSTADPQTTSLLLVELIKPISPLDKEGYIYMFWLTPSSDPSDLSSTASNLLSPPSRPLPGHRRTSDVLSTIASQTPATGAKKMLLKIGRADNVQRRLSQWTHQCGYKLDLIRFYPYHPTSSPSGNLPATPRKVPTVNKVERLIHLELGGKRVQGEKCKACGTGHREWFEVEASREGVREVDGVIRRWVEWAERVGR